MDLTALLATLAAAPNVNQGPLLERTIWILLSISLLILLLRIFAKILRTNRIYADDVLMLVAAAFGIAHAAVIQVAIDDGFGHHIVYLTMPQITKTMKFGALSLLPGFLSPMLGRLSFAWTLLYISKTDARMKTWPILLIMALQILINVAGIIVFYVQCGRDLDVFWTITKQLEFEEFCWDPRIQTYYQYFMGSFNTFTDVFLAILPAVLIEHTSLSRRSKFGLAALLCLSSLAMVASIVKTYESKILSEVTDYTYNLCIYVIWQSVELNVVIITSSIPMLRPLFRRKRNVIVEVEMPQTRFASWKQSWSANSSRVKLHMPQQASLSSFDAIVAPGSPGMITVTREVEVSYAAYEAQDAPFVHAALVGLIQGEIANPRLARTWD